MPDPRRIKRLEQVILHTVAPAIAGLADPRLSMISVTRIRLSPDLAIARVNWSCLGDAADRSKAQHALTDARGRLQVIVAKTLQTRRTPHLEFHFDESMEKAARIAEILGEIATERREREGDPEEPEETEEEGGEPGQEEPEGG